MPYVENGGGAVKGMSIEEQLWLSQFVEHPDRVGMSGDIDDDLRNAVAYEIDTPAGEIDAMRKEVIARLTLQAHALASDCADWRIENGLQASRLAKMWHAPFVRFLINMVGFDTVDGSLADELAGFPRAGQLPRSGPDVIPAKGTMSVQSLVEGGIQ